MARKKLRFNPKRPLILLLLALAIAVPAYSFWPTANLNLLILGVDGDGTRSDVMVLASINPKSGKTSLISIPRDTRVGIPGRGSAEKIAHAFAYGGPELAVETVRDFLGAPLTRYIQFDFRGFAALVEALGGVELEVEKRMDYEDPQQSLKIHLKPGRQRLGGETALQYLRFRDQTGDIGRLARQKHFFAALLAEVKKPEAAYRLPSLAEDVSRYSQHNLSPGEILTLAAVATKLEVDSLSMETLPGKPQFIREGGRGIWYWIADPKETGQLVDRVVFGR